MALFARIEALESENAALWEENTELRSRLNMNSKNSHKPPSSDVLSKEPGLSKGPSQKNGGQVAHKGKTLKMVGNPGQVVIHHQISCPCCSRVFASLDVVKVLQKLQAFDIPAPGMEVTEHQLGTVVCCGRYHWFSFQS